MGIWKQIGDYILFRKRDPNDPDSNFLRKMHWINRISIFLFLIAMIIMIIKWIRMS